jgi:hypothetical protein
MAALSQWKNQRLSLAIDTTVLWDKYCMIHLAVVCCGRAIPLLWGVLEHESATVAFCEYERLLRKARWLLRGYDDALKRLYLIAAVALLYATTTGMTVQIAGLRTTVDPHWRRGLSYLCLVQRTL